MWSAGTCYARVFGCMCVCIIPSSVLRHTDHHPKFCISPSSIRNSRNPQTCHRQPGHDGMSSPSPPMVKHWLPQMAVCLVGLMFQHSRCADESSRARSACQPAALSTDQCPFLLAQSARHRRCGQGRIAVDPPDLPTSECRCSPGLALSGDPRRLPAARCSLLWPAPLSRISPELCRR